MRLDMLLDDRDEVELQEQSSLQNTAEFRRHMTFAFTLELLSRSHTYLLVVSTYAKPDI